MSPTNNKGISEKQHYLNGREWFYDFGFEIYDLDQNRLKTFVDRKQNKFATFTKSWDDALNTEWVCRIFFASKMIMAASLMLANLEYAYEKNFRVCISYLQYYSILYSLRYLLLVLPEQDWKDGKLITKTHSSTINTVCHEIAKLDPLWNRTCNDSPSIKDEILKLKAFREFISYRAPSSGGRYKEQDIDVLSLCKVAVELAQMVSEILERSMAKSIHQDYKPVLLEKGTSVVFQTEIDNHLFFDDEDWYRIGYLFRKHPMPANIQHILSEGHVEGFFGSWLDDDERDDVFNPDEDWRILFNLP